MLKPCYLQGTLIQDMSILFYHVYFLLVILLESVPMCRLSEKAS